MKRKKEKPIAAGDAVTVLRQCADGGARMARGVVRFAAQGGRFFCGRCGACAVCVPA